MKKYRAIRDENITDVLVITEWAKRRPKGLRPGMKRVMAVCTDKFGNVFTRHIDVKK